MNGYWTEATDDETGQRIPVYIEELPPLSIGSRVRMVPGAGGLWGIIDDFSPDGWKVKVRQDDGYVGWQWTTEVIAQAT